MRTTLEKIARLYDLVEEMRGIIAELHQVRVEVKLGQEGSIYDPLNTQAAVRVTLLPGCDALEK